MDRPTAGRRLRPAPRQRGVAALARVQTDTVGAVSRLTALSQDRATRTLAVACLAAVAICIALAPLLLHGLLPNSYDADGFFAPRWAELGRALHAGHLPLWDPYALAGTPLAGDAQAGIFYLPSIVAFGVLSPATGAVMWFAFHYLLAFAGAYRFARVMSCDRLPALVAALSFAASTYLVARAQAPTLLATAAWMPACLAAAGALSERPSTRKAVILAGCVSMLWFAGAQQLVAVTVCAVAILIAHARSRRALVLGGGAVALAVALSAVQLLPMLGLIRQSTASGGVDAGGFGLLDLGDRSILAGMFANTAHETAPIYGGALLFGGALAGVWHALRRRELQLVALLAFALVWMTGLVGWIVVPVLPSLATITFHQPVRAMPLALLAITALYGQWLTRRGLPVAEVAVAAGLSLLLIVGVGGGSLGDRRLVLAFALSLFTLMAATRARSTRAWIRPVALVALLLVTAVDLRSVGFSLQNTHQFAARWQSSQSMFPSAPASARELAHLLAAEPGGARFTWLAPRGVREHELRYGRDPLGRSLLLNLAANRYGLADLAGYNPLIVRRFRDAVEHANGEPFRDRHFVWATRSQTPLLRDLAVAFYVTGRGSSPPGCAPVWSDRLVSICRDPRAQPLARVEDARGATIDRVRVQRPNADRVTISSSRGAAGTLVLAETAYPGWRVQVDGSTAKPLIVRGLLRGVEVPAGWRRVTWKFTPPGYELGRIVTLLALVLAAILLAANPVYPPPGFQTIRTRIARIRRADA